MVTLEISNTQHGVPSPTLLGYHVNPGHLHCRFFRRLPLLAAEVVPGGTWHGDTQQQKEKTVILPPFWAAGPAGGWGRGAFAESKFGEKAIISPGQRFDLL
jgi:hypothetical protein